MKFYAIVETMAGAKDPVSSATGLLAHDGGGVWVLWGTVGHWKPGGSAATRIFVGDGDEWTVPITQAQAVKIQKRLTPDVPLPRTFA